MRSAYVLGLDAFSPNPPLFPALSLSRLLRFGFLSLLFRSQCMQYSAFNQPQHPNTPPPSRTRTRTPPPSPSFLTSSLQQSATSNQHLQYSIYTRTFHLITIDWTRQARHRLAPLCISLMCFLLLSLSLCFLCVVQQIESTSRQLFNTNQPTNYFFWQTNPSSIYLYGARCV